MKIRPVGAELFRADGQTDMTKLIVTVLNFAISPKKRGDQQFWTSFFNVKTSKYML
jgi:hypothetical protein